mgnify:CR=1 FL=1
MDTQSAFTDASRKTAMKILAINLPAFHRIPENDEWWGEGFTEWDNVRKGVPLYDGHKQPLVPLHGNYYDCGTA